MGKEKELGVREVICEGIVGGRGLDISQCSINYVPKSAVGSSHSFINSGEAFNYSEACRSVPTFHIAIN